MSFQLDKEITPQELSERLKSGERMNILDVREPEEWAEGHIPGAKHIPLGQLYNRHVELDPEQEHVVVCRSGGRSAMACELLSEGGYNVINMVGGMLAWPGDIE
ncbi:rhodanese-like domain-containing protein [Paenibacillus puldeungensis]|uniref:Rhodanese-like domain-containing protein n=1 Tax=Paenibacillus puldeungensis TaxID=696536 RepID=A0ABW3RZ37_9BACL